MIARYLLALVLVSSAWADTAHLGFTSIDGGTRNWNVANEAFKTEVDHALAEHAFSITAPEFGAVCDGVTDDTAAIQAAIDAAAATRRGVVLVPWSVGSPTVCCAAGLVMTDKPAVLRGGSPTGSVLEKCASTADDHIITVSNGSIAIGWGIENLQFDCNGSATKDGVSWANVELSWITNSWFARCRRGISMNATTRLNYIAGNTLGSTNADGVNCGSGCDKNRFVGNWFDENTSRGLYINGAQNTLVGNIFQDNTGVHLYFDASGNLNSAVGNQFDVGSGGTATGVAVRIFGDENNISVNVMEDHGADTILLSSGGDNNVVFANQIDTTGLGIQDDGAGNRINMPFGASITAQSIGAGGTITANQCGTAKLITSGGAVTTDTTNTFTAPSASNSGCTMDVCNTGANNIVLDNNALFTTAAGADLTLGADDCVRVASDGAKWRQISAVVAGS